MEKESREKQIYRVTIVGSIANFFLLVFKFVAGILGQSSAMIADAVHSLSDFVTDIIVLVFVKVSAKPKDAGHDYGHGKYETLATAIIGIVLLMVGTGIFWNGLIRLRPDMTVQEAHVVATGIENRLRAKYGLRTHVAVHVEPEKNE